MKHQLASGIAISLLLVLSACGEKSTSLYTEKPLVSDQEPMYPDIPEQRFDWITEDGGQSKMEFNPQVDILFVTDNSDSMRSAQENLGRNINLFTRDIMKNRMIDYHIGTISVWDSERFATAQNLPYQIGELRYVKDSSGQRYNKRYVTKKEDGASLLSSTLKIGVSALKDGGPETEEVFSPLWAALDKVGRGDTNEEFFRPDAQLVVIIVTDADDRTPFISAKQMAERLVQFKNGKAEKVTVYGVLARKGDDDSAKDYLLKIHPDYHPECFDFSGRRPVRIPTKCTDGFGPEKLEEFIAEANAVPGSPEDKKKDFIVSIAHDFGKFLGKIGSDIRRKTLEKVIYLSQRPRVDRTTGEINLRVRYGTPAQLDKGEGQVIPLSETKGWLYDAQNNSVVLSGDIEYKYSEGARFAVDLIPLNL